ncbi:MAG: DUF5985 family protein [Candidatus Acidiferrales bacterium]
MEPSVYLLGTLISLLAAVLLVRGYVRTRKRLLLWSGVCFAGLTLSNLLVFLDLVIVPQVDLYFWRLGSAAISLACMLYGLIWESE